MTIDTEKLIVQHNAITTARYEITSAEQNIIYMLLSQLNSNDPIDKVYHIYVKDLQEKSGNTTKYDRLKIYTRKLIGRVYDIDTEKGLLQVSLISSARYIAGQGVIAIRIDPEVRRYLFHLKKYFTIFHFKMALRLKSKFSKRIYEMLSQYKNTGVMKISIQRLKYQLNLINNGKEKHKKITDFRNLILETPKRELEAHTNIHFTYELQKTGRKYTDIIFKIKQVPIKTPQFYSKEINSQQETTEPILQEKLINKYHLSPWQAIPGTNTRD